MIRDSVYQAFERATVELLQSVEVAMAETENIAGQFPQARVWIIPLNKLVRILQKCPKQTEFEQRFPEFSEQLRGSLVEVVIVGEAVAETLPAQGRTAVYKFLDSCRELLNTMAS